MTVFLAKRFQRIVANTVTFRLYALALLAAGRQIVTNNQKTLLIDKDNIVRNSDIWIAFCIMVAGRVDKRLMDEGNISISLFGQAGATAYDEK
ncbi:hypothetical protein [Alteromonas sp. CYL-A6]|uniref:hypothetical protein n=1 Tax=Alteromonas nitratireducens TaxID=3390813 RepID=UPI0034BFFC43